MLNSRISKIMTAITKNTVFGDLIKPAHVALERVRYRPKRFTSISMEDFISLGALRPTCNKPQRYVSRFRGCFIRGTEYCGRVDHHDYQLYLAINDIDHTKAKAMSPQTNGICERFHKTILNEFYQITFRKNFTQQWRDYKKIWTCGLNPITMTELIKEKCAVGVRRWTLYLMVNRFGLKII